MLVSKKGQIDVNKQTIYMDVDDVILLTSEAIIDYFHEIEPKTQELQRKDALCYDYRNFVPLSLKERVELFASERFWELVKIDEEMVELIAKQQERYNFVFVTKGCLKNLGRKYNFLFENDTLKRYESKIGYVGLKLEDNKSCVKMAGGIQVDDLYENLVGTDSTLKIMYRNKETNADAEHNGCRVIDGTLDNLYVVEFVDELDKILDFNYEVMRL